MINILIFGMGKIYNKYKLKIKPNINVIGILDNNETVIGKIVDNVRVYNPEQVQNLEYDKILLLSAYCEDMRHQLLSLGVENARIEDYFEAYDLLMFDDNKIYGEVKTEKNIMVFSHSLRTTGAQNALFTLVKQLKLKNESLLVVSLEDGVQREWYLELGVPILITENITESNEVLMQLLAKTEKVIVNTLWMYRSILLSERFNKKMFWWIHETATIHDISLETFQYIKDMKNCIILSTSELIEENLNLLYGSPLNMKRLCYGLEEYYIEHQNNDVRNCITFACIGGISLIKGQDIFIRAVDKLNDSVKNKARFWIIGSGKFDDETTELIDKNNMKFLGEIDNKLISKVYEKIDVVVCCSRKDNVPIVVSEACMNGLVSIVSDSVGTAKIMDDNKNVLLYPCGNVDLLSSKIEWVINNYDKARKIGEASRTIYDKYFSMKKFVASINDLGL